MLLVEEHIIDKGHSLHSECDRLCFLSKNLYNASIYSIRNQYELNKEYLNYHLLDKIFIKSGNVDYRALPAKVSQQIMMVLDRNYKSYFKALASFGKNPEKFKAMPKPPKFKHKTKGRNNVIYSNQAISKTEFVKYGVLKLSGTEIRVATQIKDFSSIQQVKIIPCRNGVYKIFVVYNKQELQIKEDNGLYCGIDIGLNNLFAVAFNGKDQRNLLVNGRPLKSINQYYNKKKAELKSKLNLYINKNGEKVQKGNSKRIESLTQKRNNKIKDYVHKSTKVLVRELKRSDVSKVVIGKNDGWKDEINIGKTNNQNFVSIPHANIINILKYKLELIGIQVILREESYTSKCSLIDMEPIKKHEKYLGRRVKRGLFKSKNKIFINADINGAGNILRKEIPNAFAKGIEDIVVYPKLLLANA